MDIVHEFGLRPIINAVGTATRVGGQRMHPEVIAAMADAAGRHFAIDELQEIAGREIAAATGAESGYVTAGASAGLLLGTAASIAGLDPDRIDRLPDTDGMPNEIIVQRGHRNAYDHALRTAGAKIVEVGYEGHPGAGRTHAWQIEAAIGPRTVAIALPVQFAPGTVPLPEVAEIAHRHGLRVIVDAAAGLPPKENLRRFIAEGADLVAYSGGKAIGGPQASGILAGRADLIRSAALQQLDMDVDVRTWRYGAMVRDGRLRGVPHHGVGRPAKVGKETIVGLLTALRRYLARDEGAEIDRQIAILAAIAGRLEESGLPPGASLLLRRPPIDGRVTYPVLSLDLGGPAATDRAAAVSLALATGDPPVYTGEGWLEQGVIGFAASTLYEDEIDLVVSAVRRALGAPVPVGVG
jgi:L-seryl-tRNA(Ser) seleniumtransferase